MICARCQKGKLIVRDTMQTTFNGDVIVRRIRKCTNCGREVESTEVVENAIQDAVRYGRRVKND